MNDKWSAVEAAIVSINKPRNMNKLNFAMYQHDALTLIDPELARLDKRDHLGKTLLMIAISFGRKNFVEKLIEQGANVNAVDRLGRTALMLANSGGHKDFVEKLIKAGADVNAPRTGRAHIYDDIRNRTRRSLPSLPHRSRRTRRSRSRRSRSTRSAKN